MYCTILVTPYKIHSITHGTTKAGPLSIPASLMNQTLSKGESLTNMAQGTRVAESGLLSVLVVTAVLALTTVKTTYAQ